MEEKDLLFWISGNTPSSKNNRRWTGTLFIVSDNTIKWRKKTKWEWLGQKLWFNYVISMLPRPLFIKMTFHRKSRHRFDYNNPGQTVLDEMVHHNWIIDDNANEIIPFFDEYTLDPKHPGVVIEILTEKPY